MADYQRSDLDTPVAGQRRKLINIDGDSVGAFAEKVARFFGTGDYLFWQTVFVIIWIALNVGAWRFSWDPYPFILLNLAFSTQAAYAAPLILLAQNRQEDRDRVVIAEDRRRSEQTKADTEFLARELAGVRIAVGETVTRDYLRRELEELTDLLERLEAKIDDESAARQAREHLEHGERDGKDLLAEPTMGEINDRDDDNR
ncbi:DUF1003 domain-containing protein [Corynebacterium sp. CCM 8835]|uniref:DUF1003 domain-containing protein n=1 Tax=Corynebacterium antarcticum TaxID=2800405 RepID=A0A9Q4CCQ7_9CORY|nr:DUF1003 domain-containing protein [Corynebacterium antarcticum]MCK7661446.1 DUF1003 domain-containing protein [Corynebacterium antarcticum]MCL0246183.1 DUF1003 domain-containing protein [Corynebacterium antarcticum]MCX7492433.1 DUF1003 domain-containing protein [Corynebacterium antarcticum]MCX7538455.1 DUF1003 domain-containing protein [Corynebacterium antarcticum]